MAAPTNAAKREKSSCQLGAVHTWHEAVMPVLPLQVRYEGDTVAKVESCIGPNFW
jgi:hypothetical protein